MNGFSTDRQLSSVVSQASATAVTMKKMIGERPPEAARDARTGPDALEARSRASSCLDSCGRPGRAGAIAGRSGDATAPQYWQNDLVSDDRRPQFWHSMIASYQNRCA
jgi:hypothetical protein